MVVGILFIGAIILFFYLLTKGFSVFWAIAISLFAYTIVASMIDSKRKNKIASRNVQPIASESKRRFKGDYTIERYAYEIGLLVVQQRETTLRVIRGAIGFDNITLNRLQETINYLERKKVLKYNSSKGDVKALMTLDEYNSILARDEKFDLSIAKLNADRYQPILKSLRDGQDNTHLYKLLGKYSIDYLYSYITSSHDDETINLYCRSISFPPELIMKVCCFAMGTYVFKYEAYISEQCAKHPNYKGHSLDRKFEILVIIPIEAIYLDATKKLDVRCSPKVVINTIANMGDEKDVYAFLKSASPLFIEEVNEDNVYILKNNYLVSQRAMDEEIISETSKEYFVENMDGHDFEYYCAEILKKKGFDNIEVTQGSGDQGVDIIATQNGIKYAVQCKRYKGNVGNDAVQQVYAGAKFYKCHVPIIMTNSKFTSSAKLLAEETGVVLWDGDCLSEYL